MTPTNIAVPAAASTPAAPAASTASGTASTSEQSTAVDFLHMLGQLVADTPLQQGSADMQSVLATDKHGNAASDAGDVLDVAASFPLSLPLSLPQDARTPTLSTIAAALEPVAQKGAGGLSTVAAEAQLVTQLIGDDDADRTSRPSFEIPPLPVHAQQPRVAHEAAPTQDAMLARTVHQPVGSRAWANEIGSRVIWMAENGKHTASLRLSPEHLGPLEIQVAIQDDKASVWFGAAHADTRAAIETALPRLRELFASQGLTLADTGVFREPPRQQATPATHHSRSGDDAAGAPPVTTSRRIGLGLVDAYA